MPTVSGKSCMVDCIIVPYSPCTGRFRRAVPPSVDGSAASPTAPGRDGRSVPASPRTSRRSAPVVHTCVTHRQHGRLLVELEAAVDDLAEEQGVPAELDGLTHLAVEERDRLVEDGRAGDAVVEREPVEGAGV